MMRKEALSLAFVCVLLLSASLASAVGDVAYIYKKNFKIDQNIVDAFEDLGLTIDFIDERNMPRDFSQYKLLFVGDENFNRWAQLPVHTVPSVIVNYYLVDKWGYTDSEGVSQLASSRPLSVLKNGVLIQVYTEANGFSRPSIPYYFLDEENKAGNMTTVALTEPTASGKMFGDVISLANPGTRLENGKVQQSKMCFYGIVETDYWTPQAEQLFKECVGLVVNECSDDTQCPAPTNSTPFCVGNDVYKTVTSHQCVQNGIASCQASNSTVLVEECPYQCSNGACIGQCQNDADCGTSGPIGDLFCSDKNVSQINQIFTCNNAGQANSFCSSVNVTSTVEVCSDICIDGKCEDIVCFTNADCTDNNSSTEDVCHNPGQVTSFCTNEPIRCFTNADCGTDGPVGAPFCTGLNVSQVFVNYQCLNAGTAQSSCTSSNSTQVVDMCADACVDGSCEDIACRSDSECDDSNPLTYDQCINPGTIISECRNTPINCASNLDCGTSGFTGNEFCSGDDIAKNYLNATCINPGTLESRCFNQAGPVVINECQYTCSEATCVRCNTNIDCNDNNNLTRDTCINPGTIQSHCTNVPDTPQNITCKMDSDCGVNTDLSGLFCSSEDVTKLVLTWDCVNPDTTASYCSSSVVTQTVQQCSNYCIDGKCEDIECFKNSDCNDNNSSTIDVCLNPGTPASECVHTPIDVICHNDADCGIDGFVGDNICLGDDVTRVYVDYTCKNPGTSQSYCVSDAEQKVVEECSFTCSGGQCIPHGGECTPGDLRSCGSDVGQCSSGVQLCLLNSNWSQTCYGQIGPSSEICDNKDNDCDGEIDEGGVCGPGCTDECASGAKECVNNGFRTCGNFDSDSCREWSNVTQCGSGQICEAGACVEQPPTCTNECSAAGLKQCSNNGVQTCGNYDSDSCLEWSVAEMCPSGTTCVGYECVSTCTNECVSGAKQCSGNGTQTCGNYDADSCTEWSTVTACPSGEICTDGECVQQPPTCTNECTAGATRCSGDGVQTCGNYDADSCTEWNTPVNCPSGQTCSNGQCIPVVPECHHDCSFIGQRECVFGNALRICGNYDSDGCLDWSPVHYCGDGEVCSASGQCVQEPPTCTNDCTFGARECSGNGYRTCGYYDSDSCTDWSSVASCSSGQSCSEGYCVTPPPTCTNECAIGARMCSGNGVMTCGNYDADSCTEWSSAVACGTGKECQNGQCVNVQPSCSNECTFGARQCYGNGYRQCGYFDSDSCTEWSSATTCSSGTSCSGGYCR